METMKNPGINFPSSGLAALIVTGMLLYFNYNLSKIYIPINIAERPEPISIEYKKTLEPVEIEETEETVQQPIAPTKRNTSTVSAQPPVTSVPIYRENIEKPGDIGIPTNNTIIDFQIPHVPGHFTPEQVDRRPRILRPVKPVYPYQASVSGIEGRVVLRFIVDENGRVQDPEVTKAEPAGVFEEAALAAIIKYKFIPAKIGNRNVRCIVVLPIGFKID